MRDHGARQVRSDRAPASGNLDSADTGHYNGTCPRSRVDGSSEMSSIWNTPGAATVTRMPQKVNRNGPGGPTGRTRVVSAVRCRQHLGGSGQAVSQFYSKEARHGRSGRRCPDPGRHGLFIPHLAKQLKAGEIRRGPRIVSDLGRGLCQKLHWFSTAVI